VTCSGHMNKQEPVRSLHVYAVGLLVDTVQTQPETDLKREEDRETETET